MESNLGMVNARPPCAFGGAFFWRNRMAKSRAVRTVLNCPRKQDAREGDRGKCSKKLWR